MTNRGRQPLDGPSKTTRRPHPGRRHPHPAFLEVIERFISEEQRHAAELRRWLGIQGCPVVHRTAGDAAFRTLRRFTGSLEVSLSVLMTAEIIGYVYYGAVRAATGSALLRELCDAFLRDEAAHLVFHMDTLSSLRAGRRLPGRWATRVASRLLLESACAAAWRRHRLVLHRAGMSWSAFRTRCLARLELALRPLGSGRRRLRYGIALPHGW